mmetsp:Transcript_17687/g.66799  ORF Transcript_17687/g.66799 Transcript_17687/m.66799 type:complete len:240 (+) Transcript_17687:776-1495(+)
MAIAQARHWDAQVAASTLPQRKHRPVQPASHRPAEALPGSNPASAAQDGRRCGQRHHTMCHGRCRGSKCRAPDNGVPRRRVSQLTRRQIRQRATQDGRRHGAREHKSKRRVWVRARCSRLEPTCSSDLAWLRTRSLSARIVLEGVCIRSGVSRNASVIQRQVEQRCKLAARLSAGSRSCNPGSGLQTPGVLGALFGFLGLRDAVGRHNPCITETQTLQEGRCHCCLHCVVLVLGWATAA